MTNFDQLIAAAYKTERVISRRLARHSGLPETQALKLTLERSAGVLGLPHLLAMREQARQADGDRLAAKAQDKAAILALKKHKNSPDPTAWVAWFDGSAHPNPGKLGIGGVLKGPHGELLEISRRAGNGDSCEAEYLALIAVLEAAIDLQPALLVVFGDSQVVIDDVNRQTGIGARGLHGLRARVMKLIALMTNVELRWIPRHKNAAADRLSQQAIALWHSGCGEHGGHDDN